MVTKILTLLIGWVIDNIIGDPARMPHPVVYFGKCISFGEHLLNKGRHRILKGGAMAVIFILATFFITDYVIKVCNPILANILSALLIFYCLAGTTLIREVRMVFEALDKSIEDGRRQVGRIVGRDTSRLSEQEIRKAALETLAENLSDGVVAPLFWLMILGVPGMIAYKMVNTLDSMIGYRTRRYLYFGKVAARIDDVANYIPARMTALLMILASGKLRLIPFVMKYGKRHASPNSGYPESALAGILDCQFGGTHIYFGEEVEKPYIGTNNRQLETKDMYVAIKMNRYSEIIMVAIVIAVWLLIGL